MFIARKLPADGRIGLPDRPLSAFTRLADSTLEECEGLLSRGPVWMLAATAVIVFQTALVLTHRTWLDEYQALQIALQSPDLRSLFSNLRYEGHPPLWYLLLRAASAVVAPRYVLHAVQLPIAWALGFLILFRLPLSRLERLLFATNFYILIDDVTIARSLGLGVVLFMAAVLFRKHRAAWIAVALLPLTDFLFGLLSLACIAIYLRERRAWWPGMALWILAAGAAAYIVYPAPDMVPSTLTSAWWRDGTVALARLGSILLPFQMQGWHLQWNADLQVLAGAPLGIFFIVLGWRFLPDRFSRIEFAGFCASLVAFSIAVYPLSSRHVATAGVLLVMLLAVGRERPSINRLPFRLWLAIGALLGTSAAALNLVKPFDTSSEAAAYIRQQGLTRSHWAVYPDFESQGVSAITGMEFERVDLDCMQTFVRWNDHQQIRSYADLERALESISAVQGGYYLMMDHALPAGRLMHPEEYRLLVQIPGGYDGKDYFLYRVRPDLPERLSHVPQCAPKRIPLRVGN